MEHFVTVGTVFSKYQPKIPLCYN